MLLIVCFSLPILIGFWWSQKKESQPKTDEDSECAKKGYAGIFFRVGILKHIMKPCFTKVKVLLWYITLLTLKSQTSSSMCINQIQLFHYIRINISLLLST